MQANSSCTHVLLSLVLLLRLFGMVSAQNSTGNAASGTTSASGVSGASGVCNLLCIVGYHCVVDASGQAHCVPDATTQNAASSTASPRSSTASPRSSTASPRSSTASPSNSSSKLPTIPTIVVCNMLCIRGYHQVIVNGTCKCVPINNGSSTTTMAPSPELLLCGPGEIPKQCGCDGSCANPNPICPLFCTLKPRCMCRPGYMRVAPNRCIPVSQCPGQLCCNFFPRFHCVRCALGQQCVGPTWARHCAPLPCTLFCRIGFHCVRTGNTQSCVPNVVPLLSVFEVESSSSSESDEEMELK